MCGAVLPGPRTPSCRVKGQLDLPLHLDLHVELKIRVLRDVTLRKKFRRRISEMPTLRQKKFDHKGWLRIWKVTTVAYSMGGPGIFLKTGKTEERQQHDLWHRPDWCT
jgi:hypothetical protein